MNTWRDYKARNGYTTARFLEDCQSAPDKVSTCITELDNHLGGGFDPGLHLLGGRAGVGKSAFALFESMMAAKQGLNVMFVSLEMSATDCMARCCSCISALDNKLTPFKHSEHVKLGHDLRDEGGVRNGDGSPLLESARALERSCPGLMITDAGELHGLDALTIELGRAADRGAQIVFVDYLHRVEAPGKGDAVEATKSVSGALNRVGLEYRMPVIALSALTKGASVSLDAFRDSSALNYDSHSAIILERDGERNPDGTQTLLLHVVKSRNGYETGDNPLRLVLDGAYNRFSIS